MAPGMKATAIALDGLAGSIGTANVVYTLSDGAAVGKLCTDNKVLSITGEISLVQEGSISVGVEDVSGKMVVQVHLPHAKGEGQQFAPSFLKLAKVIR